MLTFQILLRNESLNGVHFSVHFLLNLVYRLWRLPMWHLTMYMILVYAE